MLKQSMIIGERYEIMEQIGTGGMSDVYKALDHKLNRYVAIKVLKQEYSENDNFVNKFRIEAQAAAGLAHPNIVNVYDVGEEGGIHYFVMELVEGITLKKYIEKKARLSVKEAISIAIQVSMGLEAAHYKHIIHRDVKPQNIIISRDGKVKVTDFGIARAASSNTITSNAMGSVHYTSPEQARGGYSDEKSDIYSLGITMYEMVTGRVPFDGETTVAVAIKHIQEEFPSAREFLPEIPISLEQIIFKCTQKNPDLRYGSMSELIQDLKKSLIAPDDNFVKILPIPGSEETKTITEDDVRQIKRQTGKLEYIDPKTGKNNSYFLQDEEDEEDEDEEDINGEFEEDEEEYDDENEDEGKEINPKMEKVISILGIVTVIIIVFIILFIAGKTLGFFKSTSKEDTQTEETADDTTEEADEVEMIDVVGLTIDEATEKLNALSLGVKPSYETSDEYERDYVIEQDVLKGDMVEKNTTINLVVSMGMESVTIPSVTNKEEETAKTTLEDLGFTVVRDYQSSDTIEEGKVISTNPAAGTSAEKGATVTMMVSTGKEVVVVSVPDIRNLSEVGAKNLLSSYGLTWNTIDQAYNDTVTAGLVVSQSYSPGAPVNQGTAVDFTVSQGPQPEATYYYNGEVRAKENDYTGQAKVVLISSATKTILFRNETMNIPDYINVSDITESQLGGSAEGILQITYPVVIPATTNETGEVTPERTEYKTEEQAVTLSRAN